MKHIVICADGTWNSPEEEGISNVLRLAEAIAPVTPTGTKQVVFYDWGVGTDRKKLTGGISGDGLDKNIMDGYRFIVQNYDPADRLFLFGFSRGAYTVRSLAGLIRNSGILKREHAGRVDDAFELYRQRQPSKAPDAPAAVDFRQRYAVADLSPIEFLGVWDTVGSLGIPVPLFGVLNSANYLFHDTSPSRIIQCARHAMAIDEVREDFPVGRWDPKPGLDLKEVWFAGVHSDVGGGYTDDRRLSEIPAAWILREAASRGLAVEPHFSGRLANDPTAVQHPQPTGIWKMRGRTYRVIKPTDLIHSSVKQRYETLGSDWKSPAFRKFFKEMGQQWNGIQIEP
ncbi:MAG: DUF2235 domain-containing protein [Verrucomicrobiales bacterium]|nr:DUF2235 domain-containing protein [Verrucomicrobiales bacterium]